MFSLLRKIRELNLPIEMQIDLFKKVIHPVLLYACEIWGFGDLEIIERVQLKFLKMILNLKKSTPSYMIYGELGIYPLKVIIQSRIISFWTKLLDFNSNKLSSMVYQVQYRLYKQGKCKSKWFDNVKNLIMSNGYSNVWISQYEFNRNWFRLAFKQKLTDQFLQNWNALLNNSSSGINYRIFKNNFGLNNYFLSLNNKQCRIFTAFRTRNHKLPVEVGRWNGTPLRERKCSLCSADVGDEYHYLLSCAVLNDERKKYLKPYYRNHPNIMKMNELMNITNKKIVEDLVKFIDIIMKKIEITS